MFKKIGGLIVTLLALALLVYSATRSYNFISMTLPADQQILAYFGLAALDGGLIAWLLAYQYGSRGGWQRGISLLMVIVDLIGCVLMFTADSLYQTGRMGLTTAMSGDQIQTIVLALSLIIALNIAAATAHQLTDPDSLAQQANEEAAGRIEDQAREQVSKSSEQLAAELAPIMAEDWMARTRARYMNLLERQQMPKALPSQAIDVEARDTEPEPSKRKMPVYAPAAKTGAGRAYQATANHADPTQQRRA